MKKYLLLSFACLVCNCIYAQNNSRWYDHFTTIQQVWGEYYVAQVEMGFDNSYLIGDTDNVLVPPPYFSVGQFTDPVKYEYYNYPFDGIDVMQVTQNDAYKVDSVRIHAWHGGLNGMIDTLIFSVGICNHSYQIGVAEYPWVLNYTTPYNNGLTPVDTTILLFTAERPYGDSINRAVYSDDPADLRVIWKVPISGFGDSIFTVPVIVNNTPAYYSVPAGSSFIITCTYKSNAQDINHYESFTPVAGTYVAYQLYTYPADSDDNMSLLMYSNDNSNYYPTYYTDAVYRTHYSLIEPQYIDFSAHIACDSCKTISEVAGIKNISSKSAIVTAAPNPASEYAFINYSLRQPADVQIILTDLLGQTVAKQNKGVTSQGRGIFPVSDLPNGIYTYTVLAGGTSNTGKIIVLH